MIIDLAASQLHYTTEWLQKYNKYKSSNAKCKNR